MKKMKKKLVEVNEDFLDRETLVQTIRDLNLGEQIVFECHLGIDEKGIAVALVNLGPLAIVIRQPQLGVYAERTPELIKKSAALAQYAVRSLFKEAGYDTSTPQSRNYLQ